jgi:hypothetical protein
MPATRRSLERLSYDYLLHPIRRARDNCAFQPNNESFTTRESNHILHGSDEDDSYVSLASKGAIRFCSSYSGISPTLCPRHSARVVLRVDGDSFRTAKECNAHLRDRDDDAEELEKEVARLKNEQRIESSDGTRATRTPSASATSAQPNEKARERQVRLRARWAGSISSSHRILEYRLVPRVSDCFCRPALIFWPVRLLSSTMSKVSFAAH